MKNVDDENSHLNESNDFANMKYHYIFMGTKTCQSTLQYAYRNNIVI